MPLIVGRKCYGLMCYWLLLKCKAVSTKEEAVKKSFCINFAVPCYLSHLLLLLNLSFACTIGWFSNRTGTSVDDGMHKLNNWLDQWQSGKLGSGSHVWSFPCAFPSSTDIPVLMLNQPIVTIEFKPDTHQTFAGVLNVFVITEVSYKGSYYLN